MNNTISTAPQSVIDTYTPATSADVDIDYSSYGIPITPKTFVGSNITTTHGNICPNGNCGKRIQRNETPFLVEDYCLQRLDEIRRINELSHTPAAFSCLMSFIGFLSSLACDERIIKQEINRCSKFVHDYVKELYCCRGVTQAKCTTARNSGHANNNTWGEVIYSMVRCGLVHNMNVSGNKAPGQDQIRIALTHDPLPHLCRECRIYRFGSYAHPKLVAKNDEAVVLVINVFDLCDAVRKAVIRMFQTKKVQNTAKRVLAQSPIIQQIS